MLLVGVVCGPYVLDVLQPELLKVSADLRMIALIVLLLRAGLELRRDTLNRVAKPVATMSTIPSILECLTIVALAPLLFDLSLLEAGILGSILTAISLAVVVSPMVTMIQEKRGAERGVPTLILGASSVNVVFVIVIFTILVGIQTGSDSSLLRKLLEIPESIILGVLIGGLAGWALYFGFERFDPRATKMSIIMISMAIVLSWLEEQLKAFLTFSAFLGVMTMGLVILEKAEVRAHKISKKLSKVWVAAEILVFVLVGAQVNIHVAWSVGLAGFLLIFLGLVARSVGTYLSLWGTNLKQKEKMFCVVSYLPKAAVQAAIGAIPLELGVPGGEIILAVSVLAIIFTAPLGAIAINSTAHKWVEKETQEDSLETGEATQS